MSERGDDAPALRLAPEIVDEDKHDADEHAKLVLEAMRRLADEQLQRAERVRNAARNTFLFLSGLFTVAQTVAVGAVTRANTSVGERDAVVLLGVAAAVVLAYAGVVTVVVDHLRTVRDISTDDIVREADTAINKDEFVGDRLTALYRKAADTRSNAVNQRSRWLAGHSAAAVLIVLLVVAEIVLSLISRIA